MNEEMFEAAASVDNAPVEMTNEEASAWSVGFMAGVRAALLQFEVEQEARERSEAEHVK